MNTTDLIIKAKRIYTMSPEKPKATAMAIVDGKVVAVGTHTQINRWKTRGTQVIDAGDRTILPGFTDCHAHVFSWAMMADEVNLFGDTSFEKVLEKIRRKAAQPDGREWLVGNSFDKNACGIEWPTAKQLDKVTGKRPACIYSRDWHAAWVNSAGLKKAGITKGTQDPEGGEIIRDGSGKPTGLLLDNAMYLLGDTRNPGDESRVSRLWKRACKTLWSYGVTACHSPEDTESFAWFQRLHPKEALGIRIRYAFPLKMLENLEALQIASRLGDDWLKASALKIFVDGSLGSQTAWMKNAYPEKPGYYGVKVTFGEELRDAIGRASDIGLACWIHAIGDMACHDVATAIRDRGQTPKNKPRSVLRHRIEHAQCVRANTVKVMAKAGIYASMQPVHLCDDIPMADRYWAKVTSRTYPFEAFKSAGVPIIFGSDVPVETPHPLSGVYAAVTRQNRKGLPKGGWHPEQKLDRHTAIDACTSGPYRSVGDEDRLGQLAPGFRADFIVLDQDPFRCPAMDLLSARSVLTAVDGQIRYRTI